MALDLPSLIKDCEGNGHYGTSSVQGCFASENGLSENDDLTVFSKVQNFLKKLISALFYAKL